MSKKKQVETDGSYFLKLVLYIIVGSQWIWLIDERTTQVPLPLGLLLGLVYARHDHFQLDRKIEYAVLIIAALIAYWAQIGIFIHI